MKSHHALRMRVFYRKEQTVGESVGFSPSAGKPALVINAWQRLDPALVIESFEPVTRADLYQVHSRKYVDQVLDRKRNNGFGNKSKAVAHALPFVAGSMVAAALHALRTGETTFSPTSGAHHAGYDFGGGFCTFNFLALAALEAWKATAQTVGIVDCDMHSGNGTKDILKTLDFGFAQHYSFGYDNTRRMAGSTAAWLSMLTMRMQDMAQCCDLLIYNAGVDCHINDPLSTDGLTSEELAARDEIIFRAAHRARTPVVVSLAGGYQSPVSKVVKLHCNTYKMAQRYAR